MRKAFLVKRLFIVFKDNWLLLSCLFLWFLGGFSVYAFIFKLSFYQALKATFFFKYLSTDFSAGYIMWSQGVVFGVVFTFLFHYILEKCNPERGCRMLAKELKEHVVIIGYSHLGERLVNYFKEKAIPFCLIEKDKEKIDELLREGEAVIVDDARENDVLADANIAQAKLVIIASNNMETAFLVTKRARDHNKCCRIISRCFQDEFVEILEQLGANEVISSSKNAFEDIVKGLTLS